MLHIRFLHHQQELSGVGGKGLHVAALPLGVECIESQRRLAGTGEPGHHDQLVPRQIEVHRLPVVGLRAANGDEFHLVQSGKGKQAMMGKV